MFSSVCRVCLTSNVKMYHMDTERLQEIYEKVTSIKIHSNDKVPKTICYHCCLQMEKLYKFREMSQRTLKILQDLAENPMRVTSNMIASLSQGILKNLTVTTTVRPQSSLKDLNESSSEIFTVKDENNIVAERSPHETEVEEGNVIKVNNISKHYAMHRKNFHHDSDADYHNYEENISSNYVLIDANSEIEQSLIEENLVTQDNNLDNHDNKEICIEIVAKGPIPDDEYVAKLPTLKSDKESLAEEKLLPNNINTLVKDNSLTQKVSSKEFNCRLCDKSYSQASNLKTHHKKIHPGAPYYNCTQCSQTFTTKFLLKQHTGTHSYICSECGKAFLQKHYLTRHILTHKNKIPTEQKHPCSLCDKVFRSKAWLKGHMDIHTGKKMYTCNICNKKFSTSTYLNAHNTRVHSLKNPHPCKQCAKTFPTKSQLRRHAEMHNRKSYICDKCGKAFAQSSGLSQHKMTHSRTKAYQCNACSKSYFTKSHLRSHAEIHTGIRPFACNICSKAFHKRPTLNYHMRIHSGVKAFTCNICSKAFTTRSQKEAHLRVHTRLKTHGCKECSLSFATNFELKIHHRTHTGDRPFSCQQCDKSFASNRYLSNHSRIVHKGLRPYACDVCGKCFSTSTNRVIHMRTHTGQRPYACDKCDKTCAAVGNLIKHKKIHARLEKVRIDND